MGAGDFPAGEGLAGLDPVQPPTPRTVHTPPRALLVDGVTKNFLLDSAGRYVATHPIDAAVFDALRIAANSIPSVPSRGNTLHEIETIDPKRHETTVRDRIRLALARLVARGSVRILSIDVETPGSRTMAAVNYVNLELGSDAKRSAIAPL